MNDEKTIFIREPFAIDTDMIAFTLQFWNSVSKSTILIRSAEFKALYTPKQHYSDYDLMINLFNPMDKNIKPL